jgi:hypothetical protein
MTRRRDNPAAELTRLALDLDPKSVDALYGLEPVFEPGARDAALGEFVELQCPWCGEVYGSAIDLTDHSRVYIEDCQVCCQPIEVTLEVSDGGALLGSSTARVD